MSKKIFTLLLLAVFVLAQFSIASAAAPAAIATTLTSTSGFIATGVGATIDFDWSVTGMPAGSTYYVDIFAGDEAAATTYTAAECHNVATIVGGGSGSGTFTYATVAAATNGQTWVFNLHVNTVGTCQAADATALEAGWDATPRTDPLMHEAYVDGLDLTGITAAPPTLTGGEVACNTFEFWGYANDKHAPVYSGFGTWGASQTGSWATPAPIGADTDFLKWEASFPATAFGAWKFAVNPEDAAGNTLGAPINLYTSAGPLASEVADCASFTDAASVYARYLASAGLISGFADGTFGADVILTRAQAATLFEIANGYDTTTLPTKAPSAVCTFTDVADTDWFAGWVWQACADGYMNGVSAGLFDPNNTLTRGQIVTIMNNVYTQGGTAGYLGTGWDMLRNEWTSGFRSAAWNDVSIGAYYAIPVQRSYGSLIAEAATYDAATGVGTFAPDAPVTRGAFVEMLYRALSYDNGGF